MNIFLIFAGINHVLQFRLIMEIKLNITRIILGGLVGGFAMIIIGFVVHAVLLEKYYMHFQEVGSVLKEPRAGLLGMIHFPVNVLVGIPLAALYALCRNHLGPGPKTALIVGSLVGLMGLSYATAMYTFNNFGVAIPLGIGIDNLLECVAGTFVAGWLYKE
ncbi:hypothetical protein JYT36_00245 [Bacteroidales bacterium AH-315-N07]|nr:hypothetical protein [Bacteroidales bacterium AH-315-N07]